MGKKEKDYRKLMNKRGDKLYLFFIRGKIENEYLSSTITEENANADDYVPELKLDDLNEKGIYLYAMTQSKTIANDFLNYRKKDRFYMKVFDISDIDNRNDINCGLESFRITDDSLITSKYNYDDGTDRIYSDFPILITNMENVFVGRSGEMVEEDIMSLGENFMRAINIIFKSLKPEILDQFAKAGFIEKLKYTNLLVLGEGDGSSNVLLDELVVFIKTYGELLEF